MGAVLAILAAAGSAGFALMSGVESFFFGARERDKGSLLLGLAIAFGGAALLLWVVGKHFGGKGGVLFRFAETTERLALELVGAVKDVSMALISPIFALLNLVLSPFGVKL